MELFQDYDSVDERKGLKHCVAGERYKQAQGTSIYFEIFFFLETHNSGIQGELREGNIPNCSFKAAAHILAIAEVFVAAMLVVDLIFI